VKKTIDREGAGPLPIAFSDDVDTSSWLLPDALLETAKRSQAVAYGVAIRRADRPAFLRDLTHLTGGSLFEIESAGDLSAAFAMILDEFRHRYLISYSPRGVANEGWHRLSVRVKGRAFTIKARPGYMSDKCRLCS
jgi:hypothetical protein